MSEPTEGPRVVRGVMWKDGDNFCPYMDAPSSIFVPHCVHDANDPKEPDETEVTILIHAPDGSVGGIEKWMLKAVRNEVRTWSDRGMEAGEGSEADVIADDWSQIATALSEILGEEK